MAYINQKKYYTNDGVNPTDTNWGSYQYVSLEDIVRNFQLMYEGNHELVNNLNRYQLLFHAKRGIQELNYDAFKEIKALVKQLQPLASDLEFIKSELDKLKNRKIDMPEIDLSGLETAIDKVGVDVKSMQNSLGEFEERLNKVERKGGGRF